MTSGLGTAAVIFDVDGTLVDTVDLHAAAWTQTFEHFGVSVSQAEVRSQIGKGGDQLMPVFAPADLIARRGEEMERFRSALFRRDYLPQARPFPGVRQLVDRLKADGKRIAIGSSCKRAELDDYLALTDLEGVPDALVTGDDAEHSKPYPDIFLAALARLQPIDPREVVVVGDSPFDAQAAIKAGVSAVGVLSGGFPENELRAAGCVEIFRDPEALLAGYEGSSLARRSHV